MKKLIILLVFILSFSFINAQKTYVTKRVTSNNLVVDGVFDDEIWSEGNWQNDFTQNSPNNGAKATQKTEFKILYDDDYIYVAIKAFDNEPDKIEKRLSRRDSWDGDKVVVKFDSYYDKRTAFTFNVNAGGVKNDGIFTNDGDNFDDTWNPIWYVKTAITSYGWNAEMKIPLSQLRFNNQQNQTWGLEVERFVFRTQETDYWQPIPDDVAGHVSHFGTLDPSEVNLSAFETFLDEKRLFFVEGNNITNFQLTPGGNPWSRDNLFYSRRIGRAPQGFPDIVSGEYYDMPQNTRINGALKLTGKTKNGWSIGIMESAVGPSKAIINNNGTERKEIVEPLTNYFLARLQKDINKGNTIVGGMLTSTYRNIPNDNLLFLNKSAITGGLDFMQYFKKRKYYISAKVSGSHITGDKTAILMQQLSSRRYFQRPDADYLTVDSNRTSLTGHSGTFSFGKNANSGFRYSFAFTWRSPEYETNDMGYLRNANNSFQYIWLAYTITKPFSIFRRINFTANQWAGWDFGGVNNFSGGNIGTWMQFTNLWTLNASISAEGTSIDNTYNYNLGLGTNNTKKINLHTGFWDNHGFLNSNRNYGIYGIINIRPSNTLSLSVSANYNYSNNNLQYVSQTVYNNENRYIFAEIDQKTLNFTIRINYNITPDLTIQYYGSPFVSSGLYNNFKKITNSKADVYTDRFHTFSEDEIAYNNEFDNYSIYESNLINPDYNVHNPNYNFRQFNSNLVLRWEYSAGSALYLVWSQGKTDFESQGNFDFSNDVKQLFGTKGNNTVLIKFSYRFVN